MLRVICAVSVTMTMVSAAHAQTFVCKLETKQVCKRGEGCKEEEGWKKRYIKVNTHAKSYHYCAAGSDECEEASGNQLVRSVSDQLVFTDLPSGDSNLSITFKFNTKDHSFMFLENIGTALASVAFGTCEKKM